MKKIYCAAVGENISGGPFFSSNFMAIKIIVVLMLLFMGVTARAGGVVPGHKANKTHHEGKRLKDVPTLSYAGPQVYLTGQQVNLTPVSSNISPYGYDLDQQGGAGVSQVVLPPTFTGVPEDLRFDAAGNMFVIKATEIDEIPANGGDMVVIATGFTNLISLALDKSGNIYVTDYTPNQVIKVSGGRVHTKTVICTTITEPSGIAVDAAGNVYVTDYESGHVKKIQAGTNVVTTVASGLSYPVGLALNPAGNMLYVAGSDNAAVSQINLDSGVVSAFVDKNGFGGTFDIAFDHSGTMFTDGINLFAGAGIIISKFPGTPVDSLTVFSGSDLLGYGMTADDSGNVYCVFGVNGYATIYKNTPEGGYFINKDLPVGLNFDPITGTISGVPLVTSPATTYTITAYQAGVQGAGGSPPVAVTATLTITVNAAPPPAISYGTQTYAVNYPASGTAANSGGAIGPYAYMPTATTVGSGFNKPNGVAKDAAGNIYVADRGNNQVKKITPGGVISIIGSGFSKPTDVAIDTAGNIFVVDNGNNAVKKIPAGSNTPVVWGSGYNGPIGIAVDAGGTVYVADKGNNAIKRITPAGLPLAALTGLNGPTGVAVDAGGLIYVAETGTGAIERLTSGGAKTLVTFGFTNPFGIKLDNAGHCFVVNQGDGTVARVDISSGAATVVGSEFSSPEGLFVDNTGNIYVANTGTNEIKKIQPAGGYFIDKQLPNGLLFNSNTGAITSTPGALTATVPYTVTAWNPTAGASTTFNVQVIANAILSTLTISTGTLSPAFTGSTFVYTAGVTNATTSLTVTPTVFTAGATVKVNGTAVASGSASASIPLVVGPNTITATVTATDGTTTQSYTVTVTRAPSTVASLGGLVLSQGTLSPSFAAGTISYTASVSNATASVTVKPTVTDNTATVKVNGTTVASGSPSGAIALSVGQNTITTLVTAQDGTTTKTYTITVTRISNNALLSDISTTPATLLNTISGPGYMNYSTTVPHITTGIQVIPTTQDATATITVNGVATASGAASAVIPLSVGDNTITTAVTAQDGTTIKNYIITVTRDASTNANLGNLVVSPGTLTPGFSTSTTAYAVSAGTASSITVTPTVADAGTVKINGVTVASGAASGPIPLIIGDNTINVVVTAENGVTTKTYVITATRVAGSAVATLSNIALNAGTLSPSFASATTDYTANVPNATSSIKLTPTVTDANASIKVNGVTVVSGAASASLPLAVGANAITTVVTAQDGTTTKTYTVTITRAAGGLSTNAVLSSIKIAPATGLAVVSGPGYVNYTTSVPNSETSLAVTAIHQDANSTIKINGTTVASGTASPAIPLNAGDNVINIVVTAQDGTTTKTYIITATRAASSVATLSNLALSSGTLNPAFVTATTDYTAIVPNATSSIKLTPTVTDATATIKVNGVTVASGAASASLPLAVGANAITTVVTAQDGTTTKTYTTTVTRAAAGLSTNALLSSIKITPATGLTVVSGPGYVNYTTSVPGSETSLAVTAIHQDANSTIKINGTTVASGTASPAIPLNVGDNVINIVVTAQDGATTKTYIITATRSAAASIATLSNLGISAGTLSPVFASPTTDYTVIVPNATSSIKVTPTVTDANATIKVNGVTVASGAASASIPLVAGSNTVTTEVTAQDGATTKTYTVTVTRAATGLSTNALLSSIKISPATGLTVVSGPGYVNYTTSVQNSETSLTVTAIHQDANSTIKINRMSVASGTASPAIPLNAGDNVIDVVVTAQDGATTKTYIITATRAASGMAMKYEGPAAAPILSAGVTVHQAVSPNGDGDNDVLTIEGINNFPDNSLTIMNRTGTLIYEAKGYNNGSVVFDGHSSKNGKLQQAGTYFYSLEYKTKDGTKHTTGFIMLKY